MSKILTLFAITLFLASLLNAGSDTWNWGEYTGTTHWQVGVTEDETACEGGITTDYYSIAIAHNMQNAVVGDFGHGQVSGTFSNNVLHIPGRTIPDGDGTSRLSSLDAAFSSNCLTFSGGYTWDYSDAYQACSGSTALSGTNADGRCPQSDIVPPEPSPKPPPKPPPKNQPPPVVFKTENRNLITPAISALENAATNLYQKTNSKIKVTEESRTVLQQSELFYDNCLKKTNAEGRFYCTTGTCNPAKGKGIIEGDPSSGYSLAGELKGVTDRQRIISALANNGEANQCMHTSNIAVDAWCDSGSNWVYDPNCQAKLTEIMNEKGFCRLDKEGWHFEWKGVSSTSAGCKAHQDATYTDRNGNKIDPTEGGKCLKYNYKTEECTQYTGLKSKKGSVELQEVPSDAEIVRADGTVAPAGTKTLSAGDTIRTKSTKTTVMFDDGSVVDVGPNSEFSFYSHEQNKGKIDLLKGQLKMIINKALGIKDYRIITSNAVIAVRGTQFVVDVQDGKTLLYLNEGNAIISPWKVDESEPSEDPTFAAGQVIEIGDNGINDVSVLNQNDWDAKSQIFESKNTTQLPSPQPQPPKQPVSSSCPFSTAFIVLLCGIVIFKNKG